MAQSGPKRQLTSLSSSSTDKESQDIGTNGARHNSTFGEEAWLFPRPSLLVLIGPSRGPWDVSGGSPGITILDVTSGPRGL